MSSEFSVPAITYDHDVAYQEVLKESIEFVADTIASAELQITTPDGEKYPKTQVYELIKPINGTYYDLIFNTMVDWQAEGNYYWLIPEAENGEFIGFIPLPGRSLTAEYDNRKKQVVYRLSSVNTYYTDSATPLSARLSMEFFSHYGLQFDRSNGILPVEENWRIVHFKKGADKRNPYMGVGYLESAKSLIEILMWIVTIRLEGMKKGGYFPHLFKRVKDLMVIDVDIATKKISDHIKMDGIHKTNLGFVQPDGLEIDPNGPTYEHFMNFELERIVRDQISMIIGVHPAMLGGGTKDDRAGLEEIEQVYRRNILPPKLRYLQRKLDTDVYPVIEMLQGCTSELVLPPLPRDNQLEMKKYNMLYDSNALTCDELRRAYDLDPMPEGSGKKYKYEFELEIEGAKERARNASPGNAPTEGKGGDPTMIATAKQGVTP